jgi:hypothetical protein
VGAPRTGQHVNQARGMAAGRSPEKARRLIAQVVVRIQVHLALLRDPGDDPAPAQADMMMRKALVGHELERGIAAGAGARKSLAQALDDVCSIGVQCHALARRSLPGCSGRTRP